jgi:hypothetical protein
MKHTYTVFAQFQTHLLLYHGNRISGRHLLIGHRVNLPPIARRKMQQSKESPGVAGQHTLIAMLMEIQLL